jgi:hypothetical protein
VTRDHLRRLAVCLHLRRPETPDMKRFRFKPEEVPKGFTAYDADCCKYCTRLIIWYGAGWVHRAGKVVHCAGHQTAAEPLQERDMTEAGR